MKRRGSKSPMLVGAIATLVLLGLIACGPAEESAPDTAGETPATGPESAATPTTEADTATATAPSGQLGELVPTLELAHYSSATNPEYPAIARILEEDYEKLGFDIQLVPMDFNVFVSQITVGHQIEDIAQVNWGGDPDRLDPNHWLGDLNTCGSARNAALWCDEQYDQMYLEQSRTLDLEQRQELVYQMQEYHNQRLPQWLIMHPSAWMIWNSDKFENATNPQPVPVHESRNAPWLDITPTTDDRILDWGRNEDVSTWNVLSEVASFGWLRMVYQTFLADANGDLVPWAATEWELVDPTTVDVKLREGATFHDGEPVTAEDAAFTYNFLLELRPPTYEVALTSVESAEAIDEHTLRVHLSQPNASFFRKSLVFIPILPEHIWSNIPGGGDPLTWDPRPDNVIGSGPFVFDHWNKDQEHFMTTYQDFFQPAKVDGIRRVVFGSADALQAALIDGSVDFASNMLVTASAQQLGQSQDHLTWEEIPTHGTRTVVVNHDKPLFQDYAVRQALRLATDKQRIIREATLGIGRAAGEGPIPIVMEYWYKPNLEEWGFDIEKARQILSDAGYGWDDQGRIHFPAGGPDTQCEFCY